MSQPSLPTLGGTPAVDNRRRLYDRRLDLLVASNLRIRTPRGRRRKKHLTIIESANFKNLIVAVSRDLAQRSK